MAEHTPGPWHVEDQFDPNSALGPFIWADGMMIARVAGWAEFDAANARLIAAAPSLLAACRAMLRVVGGKDEKAALAAIDLTLAATRNATDPDDFRAQPGDEYFRCNRCDAPRRREVAICPVCGSPEARPVIAEDDGRLAEDEGDPGPIG